MARPKKHRPGKVPRESRPPARKAAGSSSAVQKAVYIAIALFLVLSVLTFGLPQVLPGTQQPGTAVPEMASPHISDHSGAGIPYNSDPPTSGPHPAFPPRWGIHSEPIPKAWQLHYLEDGGVLVQYNGKATPETIETLRSIVEGYSEYVALAPYPDMKATIALTAWGRIDTMGTADVVRITRFIDAYRGIDHHKSELP